MPNSVVKGWADLSCGHASNRSQFSDDFLSKTPLLGLGRTAGAGKNHHLWLQRSLLSSLTNFGRKPSKITLTSAVFIPASHPREHHRDGQNREKGGIFLSQFNNFLQVRLENREVRLLAAFHPGLLP